MAKYGTADLVLRAGVAFAFLYPPFNALSDPNSWIGYFPGFMLAFAQAGYVSEGALLHAFGALEAVLGLWILSGYKIALPASIAAALLVAIVVLNLNQFQILFRDLSIAAAALYLAVAHARGMRPQLPI